MRELTASQYQVLHAKKAELPHNIDTRPAWRKGQSPILVASCSVRQSKVKK